VNLRPGLPGGSRPPRARTDTVARSIGLTLPLGLALLAALACPSCRTPSPATPELAPAKVAEIDDAIESAVAAGRTPGGVFWIERTGRAYHRAYGQRAIRPAPEPAAEDTIYDLASLTKVLATTPSIMLLVERGQIDLDAPVQRYIPEFTGEGRELVAIRHLMTHTSGLRPGLSLTPAWTGAVHAIQLACAEKLTTAPGAAFRYSDINFILLGEVVGRVSGTPLDQFAEREIYRPLRMKDTGFRPPADWIARIAPTEQTGDVMLRGVVHDPTSRAMGGVAGHAGLFSTAADVARFARMMIQEGCLDGVRLFQPATVRLMTTVQTPPEVPWRRGLGWDIDSGYARPRGQWFPVGSYGHTGWTGTAIWVDPFSKTFWLFLGNRVHPDGKGNVLELWSTLGSLAAESVVGFNFAGVPGSLPRRPEPSPSGAAPAREPDAAVLNGIDVLAQQGFAPLQGLKIGLITNPTGIDRQRRSTIDLLHQAPGVQLRALFSPEHGIRGDLDEKIGDSVDSATGLPVYSLYGETRQPSPAQLQGLDALVFDIQDIGTRFYTYISTLGLALEAAGKQPLPIFVLDRVNPINGIAVEGPVLDGPATFTGFHPIPVRHAMTVGELARMFNQERKFGADLRVIPVQGWRRSLWFDETGLPWINPSPNMRSLTEAALYPGIGLLEMSALSVGRGTGTPFEVIGAPYIDEIRLASELNRAGLAGVRFVPIRFTPVASKFKGQECRGVNILLTDRDRCQPIRVGLAIARLLHRDYPGQFQLEKLNTLLVHPATVQAVRQGKPVAEIESSWSRAREEFARRRASFLLYP